MFVGEIPLARSKPQSQQPNIVSGFNSHSNQTQQLAEQVKNLKLDLAKYVKDECARQNLWGDYQRIQNLYETSDSADLAKPPVITGKVAIQWLSQSGDECRRASVTIPDSWDKPIIFAKGDEQVGHITCDEKRVIKDIDWVESNPQCLVFLLGDAIDSATKTSPGSIRENTKSPLKQVEYYVELHKRIADRIIGFVGGNHERRIDKALDDGGAAIRLLAKGLSIESHKIPYSSGVLLIDVYWHGHVWTFTLFHGAGAAATAGSKIQRMQRNLLLTDSSITLSGHLHDEAKTSRRYVKRSADGSIKITKQTSLQCGTYLRWIGSYGEVGGMSPTGPDMIVIELLPDGKYIDRFKGEGDI